MIRTALLALALAGAAITPAAAQPPAPVVADLKFQLPAPTGPHPIGTVELHLTDAARADPWAPDRRRELMVSIWYPAAKTAGLPRAPYMHQAVAKSAARALLGPVGANPDRLDLSTVPTHAVAGAPARGRHPVVLYSPGGNQPRAAGTVLVEDLASRGYIVVTIDHTHEPPAVVFPGGRVAANAVPRTEDVLQRMLAARVADTRFVLDELARLKRGRTLPPGLAAAMDLERTGMFGHSAGGFTAFETALVDRRLDAVVDLDGSLGYQMSKGVYGAVVEKGLDRPFMFMGGGVIGPQRQPHTHLGSAEWKRLWDRSTGWKADFYMAGAEHMAFSDQIAMIPALARELNAPPALVAGAIGVADPARVLAAQRAYIAAFFDQHLKRKPQPLLDGKTPGPYPEVARIP